MLLRLLPSPFSKFILEFDFSSSRLFASRVEKVDFAPLGDRMVPLDVANGKIYVTIHASLSDYSGTPLHFSMQMVLPDCLSLATA